MVAARPMWVSRAAAPAAILLLGLAAAAAADRGLRMEEYDPFMPEWLAAARKFLFNSKGSSDYHHVWPPLKFGWQIVIGSIIGFLGSALGIVGGLGGGGIYVPMLTLIVGFDPKSAAAISKCMVMGASASAVYYNLKLRHPTLEMPVIDYDLALLIQPMLILGISIGVIFNVIFPDWLVTVLLIILFLITSIRAFQHAIMAWNEETLSFFIEVSEGSRRPLNKREYHPIPEPVAHREEVPLCENVYWKELGILCFVWVSFLILQVTKNYTPTCSAWYWVLNLLQFPIAIGVTGYEAISILTGRRRIASTGEDAIMPISKLITLCSCGILAGMVGGLLGLGGGFILSPLFLELGILPQVSRATATFAMMFSSSMSVVEYYLLNRFPIPYAEYFIAIALLSAWLGQHGVRRFVTWMGRPSIIIFIMASFIFVSAISLGGFGISNTIENFERHEYQGFLNLCEYKV